MKKIIYLLVATCILNLTVPAFGQVPKFGHINSAELLSLMPEVKATDTQLLQYQQELQNQNEKMLTELENKYKEYRSSDMSAVNKEVLEQEIRDMESRITNFQQSAPEKLEKKKEELYGPILEKAQKVIQEVAKENGYIYVFDTSVGALIEFPDADNILELVKKRLNL